MPTGRGQSCFGKWVKKTSATTAQGGFVGGIGLGQQRQHLGWRIVKAQVAEVAADLKLDGF